VSKVDKIYEKLMSGRADANFSFDELCSLLSRLGYQPRQRGSHLVFKRGESFINLQEVHGKAKPYQARQAREQLKIHDIHP
jgi:hypothetical protein